VISAIIGILSAILSILEKLIPTRSEKSVRDIVSEAEKNRSAVSWWIANGGLRHDSDESGDEPKR
jgi:hypothetical protein